MYCNVIVTRPFNQVFTYEAENDSVKKGQIVTVPFGNSMEIGMVVDVNISQPKYKIKKISKAFDSIYFDTSLIKFIYWIHNYTLAPLGLVLKLFTINIKITNFKPLATNKIIIQSQSITLNKEQETAVNNISNYFTSQPKPIVLEGVTGSGKTEVYFEIVENYIAKNKQILIMLPEISLTPQLENRFLNRFGVKVDIWHSKISEKNRKEIWQKSIRGDPIIVIGARSSLFLPFSNLGLMVVDEEHDSSYKQEDNIRYQARDLAVVRAQLQKCALILSSATPSLETQNNINKKKYHHVFLSKQYSGLPLPAVELVDLNKFKPENNNWISSIIINELKKCLQKKEQALIFLNRRGYSPLSLCKDCGYRFQCLQCSSSLVLHKQKKRLLCHHCGYIHQLDNICPKCSNKESIKLIGPGIERIEEELQKYFPKKNISIMSSDNANTTKKIKIIIDQFINKKIDILVATQIMTKGYDFSNLSFVGVVDADEGLFGGDMRAIEKTFNLLQQVSGRAGRANKTGKVMIQTYYPKQPVMEAIKNRDRNSFLKQALIERQQFKIPPFGFITAIILSSSSKTLVEKYSSELVKFPKKDKSINVLGPVEASIFLLRGKYRFRLLLKGNSRKKLNKFTVDMLNFIPKPSSIKVIIDVDPYTFN